MASVDPLQTVLTELNSANAKLGQAVLSGDLTAIDSLTRIIGNLEQERNSLLDRISRPAPQPVPYAPGLSARDRIVHLLRLTDSVTSNQVLSDLSRATFHAPLESSTFATVRRDERRAWASGSAPQGSRTGSAQQVNRTLVVPALSHDRFVAVRGAVALSDWPVERRMIAPSSPRVDFLRATAAVATKAADDGPETPLARVVAKFAAGLGIQAFQYSVSDLCRVVVRACHDELKVIEPNDTEERLQAAARATKQLSPEAVLFGTQLAPLTSRGAPRKTPKKPRAAS